MSDSEDQVKDAEIGQAETAEKTPEASPPNKATKKPKKRRHDNAAHRPPFIDMITESISNMGEKNGSSLQAIKRYIADNFDCDMEAKRITFYVRVAIKAGVNSGKLIQTKGKGANGSFKLGNVVDTMTSKPTKRQIASAETAARDAAKAQKAAKRAAKAAKRPKQKKHVTVTVQKKAAARRAPVKKPTAKKAAKSKKGVKKGGRKGRK